MKKLIMAIVALTAMSASAEYVTVTVCDGGESGTECRTVTYKVRPASPAQPQVEQCPVGEAGYGPCPTNYGIPSWLRKLNQHFADHGYTAPPVEDDNAPGGPN